MRSPCASRYPIGFELETNIKETGVALFLHTEEENEIEKHAANLKAIGADAHAALLSEMWPHLQGKRNYKLQQETATARWAELEAAGPLSAILTHYATRHRDAILQCIRQVSDN